VLIDGAGHDSSDPVAETLVAVTDRFAARPSKGASNSIDERASGWGAAALVPSKFPRRDTGRGDEHPAQPGHR
jgi:hypothetical protein